MSPPTRPSPADVTAFERRLQQAGDRRRHEGGDASLADLLGQIDARRRRRLTAGRGTATPAGARTGAAAGMAATAHNGGRPSAPPGTVLSIEPVGPGVRIFRVAPPADFRFRAGQYVKVGRGDGKRRSFSLASAPHEPHLELCIALNPGGRLTPTLFTLHAGALLDIDPRPRGGFVLEPNARRHLMVATGTGIAPLRSMLRDALHTGARGEFVILHGASQADGLPYRDELVALAAADGRVRYEPTVSRPAPAQAPSGVVHTGRVDRLAAELSRSLDPRDTQAYVCGNPDMVTTVAAQLASAGFRVSREAFD
jgi:ferredoxin-NADP reductase